MQIQTVGIVGYGHFGAFLELLLQRFFPEVEIRIYSRRKTSVDGHQFVDLNTAAGSDVVFLCGAIRDYETQLTEILPHTHEQTILVDVATVKVHPTNVFKRLAGERKWISTHPMFGPESYQKQNGDVSGFRIVITDYTLPNDMYMKLAAMLAKLGFVVIEMTAEEHDKLLAETLFVTHLIGQTIETAGFGRTQIDTVSFNSLMNAVESVKHDVELFKDVYRFNPYCREVAAQLQKAEDEVLRLLK